MNKRSATPKRTPKTRRPRRLAERLVTIASRDTLPDKRFNTLVGGWRQTSATESDVQLYEHAPEEFQVAAMLRGDESYLWIGLHREPGDRRASYPFAIVKGDTLRKLVTEYLKHFNAGIFADAERVR